jgi:hypothetical protein
VAVVNGLAFVVFAATGLPLLGRYLFTAAAMLAVFAGVAAFGWLAEARSEAQRAAWRAAGLVVVAAIVAFTPMQAGRLDDLRDDIAKRDEIQSDLLDLVHLPEAEAVLSRCRPLYVPNHRAVPELAYWTDTRPTAVISAQLERPTPRGSFITATTEEVKRLSILDPRDPKRFDAEVPPGYRLVARNRSWLLYGGCPV